MSLQTTHSTTTTLDAIRTYVRLFKRAHLVPGRPLSQLSWNHPVVLHGWTQYTTIQVLQSRFNIKLGDGGGFTAETILLVFTTPATVFQLPVICGIHIPIFMWYNGVTQRQGPEFLSDPREPGFQIGAREVREAIRSHLLARWCDLHQPMPRPPRSSLFGQVLVREYVSATFVAEKLRYLIFEVPKEQWDLNVGNVSPITTVRWTGSMGRLIWSSNDTNVFLRFVLQLTRPTLHSISWRTVMARWNEAQIDDVRNEVVARIFLEADPPI